MKYKEIRMNINIFFVSFHYLFIYYYFLSACQSGKADFQKTVL